MGRGLPVDADTAVRGGRVPPGGLKLPRRLALPADAGRVLSPAGALLRLPPGAFFLYMPSKLSDGLIHSRIELTT